MSFNFADTRITAISPPSKDVQVKAVKLTYANFTTGGVTSGVLAVLPQDASIIGFRYFIKNTFTGNGVSGLTFSIGVPGNNTKYAGGFGPPNLSAGSYERLNSVSNLFQDLNTETSDIQITFTGTATTGNPTSGEMYLLIEYVR